MHNDGTGAAYTIHATWNEPSSNPPAEAGSVLRQPVIYTYDPKECQAPQ